MPMIDRLQHPLIIFVGAILAATPTDAPTRATHSSAEASMISCQFRGWSAPRPVTPDSTGMVARFPRLAIGRDRSYVVGNDIQMFDDRVVQDPPLAAWELGGRSIGRPSGRFAFLFPRGGVDSRGRLHLLWAEPTTAAPGALPARRWYFQAPTSVWSAIYEPSKGWSEPIRVQDPVTRVTWSARGSANDFGGLGDAQGIAIQTFARESWKDQPLLILSLGNDRWTHHDLAVPQGTAYTSLVVDRRLFLLAYIKAASPAAAPPGSASSPNTWQSDKNSVFVRLSHDGGQTWSEGKLVSRSGGFPAHQIHALIGPRGEFHLVWKQTLAPPGGGDVVRHVLSTDGGATWSAPDDLTPPGQFDGIRAVVDGCGSVHVVYEDWRKGPDQLRLGYATWKNAWSAPAELFDSLMAMTPDLRMAATGEPLLVFVARASDTGATARYMTLYARLER